MNDARKTQDMTPKIYLIGAAVVIVLLWGWFLMERATDLRLVGSSGVVHSEPIHWLVPAIATPVVAVVAFVLWRRTAGILKNGVEVQAVVRSIGMSAQGRTNVVLAYSVDGTEYSTKKSVSSEMVEKVGEGGSLTVIVDKQNPRRLVVGS